MGRAAKIVVVLVGALLLSGGGVTYAAYRYDRANAGRILPGVRIAGVDVSGMTHDQALAAVRAQADARLSRPLRIVVGDHARVLTPGELGMTADVEGAVDQAMSLSDGQSFLARVWHRFRDQPLDVSIPLGYATTPTAVRDFVSEVARKVDAPARDATVGLVNGQLAFEHSKTGRELKTDLAAVKVENALSSGASSVSLPIRDVVPQVTDKTLGNALVIDLSENRLYLYDGFKIERTYPVATAMPGFTTPVGTWSIVNKVENPTWYNPAPNGWGAGEPLQIPPGPGNPLGTRALYLSAPGIRIHGTFDTASVGTYASHGCIRMTIADSEALYPLIPVGTTVIIKP